MVEDDAALKYRLIEHPTDAEAAIDKLVLYRGSDKKVSERDLFLFRTYNGWQKHDVFSREFLSRLSSLSGTPQAEIENRLADLRFTIVDTDAEAKIEQGRREGELAEQIQAYTAEEKRKQPQPFWTDFKLKAALVLGASLLISLCVAPLPEKHETAEERLIREMKEGQRAVCDKWGELRPECR